MDMAIQKQERPRFVRHAQIRIWPPIFGVPIKPLPHTSSANLSLPRLLGRGLKAGSSGDGDADQALPCEPYYLYYFLTILNPLPPEHSDITYICSRGYPTLNMFIAFLFVQCV